MVRAGIDPGKEGFFCVQTIEATGSKIDYYPMPTNGYEIDLQELNKLVSEIFTKDDVFVILEQVHAIFGSSAGSTWEFSRSFAVVEMALVANKVPYELVPPKTWQKEMFSGVAKMQKPSSTGKTQVNDTKAMALTAAKRLFPNEDLRKSERAKKPDNNKVDALLISEYCKRKHK